MQQEHALVPVYIGNSGAGFIVRSGIGQFIIIAKPFAIAARTDASLHIHFFTYGILPYPVNRMQ